MIKSIYICLLVLSVVFATGPSLAEVRIGNGVRIGGNKIKPQVFDKDNRGEFIIHEDDPKEKGCKIRQNSDGSKTKVCHLKRLKN
tara:strand:- start:244 stop:498 length:255 start_codon:yes stop_codon:yes gene_type:complete